MAEQNRFGELARLLNEMKTCRQAVSAASIRADRPGCTRAEMAAYRQALSASQTAQTAFSAELERLGKTSCP